MLKPFKLLPSSDSGEFDLPSSYETTTNDIYVKASRGTLVQVFGYTGSSWEAIPDGVIDASDVATAVKLPVDSYTHINVVGEKRRFVRIFALNASQRLDASARRRSGGDEVASGEVDALTGRLETLEDIVFVLKTTTHSGGAVLAGNPVDLGNEFAGINNLSYFITVNGLMQHPDDISVSGDDDGILQFDLDINDADVVAIGKWVPSGS